MKDRPEITLPKIDTNDKSSIIVRESFIRGISLSASKLRLVIRTGKDEKQFDFPFSDVVVGKQTESWESTFKAKTKSYPRKIADLREQNSLPQWP